MDQYNVEINEYDKNLTENEFALKRKIFSLPKMEALIFSDPKLTAVYEKMVENGSDRYGYHYNETVVNTIFNDYVLNSPKYLQKYKMAIPKQKKRRDKSGINQLKKAGEMTYDKQTKQQEKNIENKEEEVPTNEMTGGASSGGFAAPMGYTRKKLTYETTGAASSGAYATPNAWGKGDLIKGKTSSIVRKPIWHGGTIIGESTNYLIDPSGFEVYAKELNEADLSYQEDLGKQYNKSHTDSNKGLGISELPQTSTREKDTKDIDDNTPLYVGQDISLMRDADVNILKHDVMDKNSLFPHKDNEILKNDGISGSNNIKEDYADDMKNKKEADNYIDNKTSEFDSYSVDHWDKQNTDLELNTIKSGSPDKPDLSMMENKLKSNDMKLDKEKNLDEKAKSKEQQRLFGMAHAVQKGELSPSKVGGAVKKIAKTVSKKDVEDFASTKHKGLPEKIDETDQSMIDDTSDSMANTIQPVGTGSGSMPMGMADVKESIDYLKELDEELNAYDIHYNKLKEMTEDRKPSALVLKDRVGAENKTNFKRDLEHSGTKEIIDTEKELMYKNQQTEVEDPHKLGQEIENKELDVTKGKSFKNVGNSTNDKGDEVPKRNMTEDEQNDVDMYRLGMQDWVYDNKPDERFEDRMKSDMGEKLYKQRQDKMEMRAKAPMYNKDPQPVEDTTSDKVQFNKEQSKWNERTGLKESLEEVMVTGKYENLIGKKHFIDFTLDEIKMLNNISEANDLFKLDCSGLGNSYENRCVNNKLPINEEVVNAMNDYKFYTNGNEVFAIKREVKSLNENETKKPNVLNEEFEKMKHLFNYNTNTYINTKNTKNNRGF